MTPNDYVFLGIVIAWLVFFFWVQICRTKPINDDEVEVRLFGETFRMPRLRFWRGHWVSVIRRRR